MPAAQKGARHAMTDHGQQDKGLIAKRLDRLFETVLSPSGNPYSQRDVVDGINSRAGRQLLSTSYLSQLRLGDRQRPGPEVLAALAEWFGVRPAYFLDDEEEARRTEEELEVLQLMRDARLRTLVFSAAGMSADALRLVTELVDQLRKHEGLPGEARPGGDEAGKTAAS